MDIQKLYILYHLSFLRDKRNKILETYELQISNIFFNLGCATLTLQGDPRL